MTSLVPADLSGPSAVYRIFFGRELLYIGYARDVYKRMAEHARLSPWWPPLGRGITHTAEWFASRDEAALAEAIAIVRENPRHNKRRDRYRWVGGEVIDLATCPLPTPIPS